MRASGTRQPPATIDAYLKGAQADQRAALERLRTQIHAAAPGAEECISYQMPAFRLKGRILVWFACTAKHCAFYPGGLIGDFADELKPFSTSKGTIRFQPDAPLPPALVKRIVKAAIARNAAMSAPRVKRR